MVDLASGFVILRPLRDKAMITIARELFHVFSLFGFPRELQSDRGSEFVNHCVTAVLHVALVQARLTAPWNPRCNGAAENRVKQVKSAIFKAVSGNTSRLGKNSSPSSN